MTQRTLHRSQSDLDTLKKQVVIETYRSHGPGGQRKNKTETAVRLRHVPTGITVTATEQRFQSQNLRLAFERLRERLHLLQRRKRPRIPTKASPKSIEKRIGEKKLRAGKKKLRKTVEKDRLFED